MGNLQSAGNINIITSNITKSSRSVLVEALTRYSTTFGDFQKMRFHNSVLLVLAVLSGSHAFNVQQNTFSSRRVSSALPVSIGLGPEEQTDKKEELVAGVDYEVPDHESLRTSRRNKLDVKCDDWFRSLVGEASPGFLGSLATDAHSKLTAQVELKNDFMLPMEDPEYTPYVNEKLPWEPLLPAFGLEEFGLPVPRRNAETWRHFDVIGMVNQDYSASTEGVGTDLELSEDEVASYKEKLVTKGGWLEDDVVSARLVYINGRFCPQLSLTTEDAKNMDASDLEKEELTEYLARLTDGFTDELAAPVPSGPDDFLESFATLSAPNHCVGEPTSQFAINSQQGTACFAALNTLKTGAVAYIHNPAGTNKETEGDVKPVLLLNAISGDLGASSLEEGQGVSCHPRALVVAEEESRMSLIQSCIDLDGEGEEKPTLYNGYTQVFVKEGADVKHSYLEETGGMVTGGIEISDNELPEGTTPPREIEAQRAALKDTHLETIDVHLVGDDANYEKTMMCFGGSGRVRVGFSVALLRPGTNAVVKGFSLAGGAQRADIKTNIHHIAQGCTSEQLQKNMVGGRATGGFRGRIRVEQSAQQTASDQLSRTILLSDRCRSWSAPTLEIIADDVQCAHGATVSDLSEEELFYLRSRGLDRATARNMLMYAFAGDISACIDPALRGEIDSTSGVTRRVIQRLENLVPRGDRKVKGQFQSS